MIWDTLLFKYSCLSALTISTGISGAWLLHAPDSVLRVHWLRYTHGLEQSFVYVAPGRKGSHVAIVQCVSLLALLLAVPGLQVGMRDATIAFLIILFLPKLWIHRALKQRAERIDRDVVPLLVALANSLKASPSLGRAFARAENIMNGPLGIEVSQVNRDLRLGSSVEQALLALGARVQSQQLNAALTGILIGRQVGGNLPDILESTASTMREMERLDGVIRSKTAEGKAQVFVIALAPALVYLAFEGLQDGYFAPFTATMPGLVLLATCCTLWLAAVISAKKILTLDI